MRQKADGGLSRLGQKTPNAPGETLPEMNTAQMAFNMNQSSAVVLPVFSDSQKLIWVYSNEINLQMDGAAELNKTFKRFPYLTQKQTVALAQRCSLHPDQVKVWFMLQRLRYGISWDCKDIHMVRKKFKSSGGKDELQKKMGKKVKKDRGNKKKCKRHVKEPGGKTAGEGRMMGENVWDDERLVGKVKQEQPMKKERDRQVDKDKQNTQKKRKRMTVTDKMEKKKKKLGEAGEVAKRNDEVDMEWQKSTQTETKPFTRKKKKAKKGLSSVQEFPDSKGFVVPDELQDASIPLSPKSQTQDFEVLPLSENQTKLLKSVSEMHTEPTNLDHAFTDVCKLKFIDVLNNLIVADGSPIVTEQQIAHVVDSCRLFTRVRHSTKTRTQLAMMKVAFLYCQYPDAEDYSRLAMAIDVPRDMLVQWYGDMRYYIKKGRPRWMNKEQHSRVLTNIQYRQCLNALIKTQVYVGANQGSGEATWKMKVEKSVSCVMEESVPLPLEGN